MNRLHHLKKTLITNILANSDYHDVEFVLMDYNSSDGLSDFIKTNLQEYLNNGKLIYYKTNTPDYFNRSHSRNLVFRLASGDLICNIDADNFTGSGFAAYLNWEFQKKGSRFLTAIGSEKASQDVLGRICVRADHFYELTGYDELMSWYGFEDHDFANRLELNAVKRIPIPRDYLTAITHEQTERLLNERISADLLALYVNYLTPASTDFLFLFKDGICRKGILVNNDSFDYTSPFTQLKRSQLKYEYSIYEDAWIAGIWNGDEQRIEIRINANSSDTLIWDKKKNCFVLQSNHSRKQFYRLTDLSLIEEAIMFFSQVSNRLVMSGNKLAGKIAVNDGFGRDTVYKNFNDNNPIVI
ncbi:MAG TPA: hypothetical protein DIT07_10060 [Sphingobacteriaceae bacterium]|nr:hypothetical protein [Sphingobacteriaceae bacterium]